MLPLEEVGYASTSTQSRPKSAPTRRHKSAPQPGSDVCLLLICYIGAPYSNSKRYLSSHISLPVRVKIVLEGFYSPVG